MGKGVRRLGLTILLGAVVGLSVSLGSWIGANDEPEWVEAMRKVHRKFSGQKGHSPSSAIQSL